MPREIFFFKNYAKNEPEELVPVCFLLFKKALYYIKESRLQLDCTVFRYASN